MRRSVRLAALLAATAGVLAARPLAAQTDYFNTDAGRPVQIEDAYATERHAFELQLAPLRVERHGGQYEWSVEPELAYGLLPGAHLEVGLPLVFPRQADGGRTVGVAGVDASMLYNLNSETRLLPAFALAAEALLPAGAYGPERASLAAKGIATRTFGRTRLHLNGRYTFGDASDAAAMASHGEAPERWMGGLALDRVFPLNALLVIGEVLAAEPLAGGDVEWTAGVGLRYQIDPHFAFDIGFGGRVSGDERPVYATMGLAKVFGIRSLIPTGR